MSFEAATAGAPGFIPPRTSSHRVTSHRQSTSEDFNIGQPSSPESAKKRAKRPLSTTLEGLHSPSNEKKSVTESFNRTRDSHFLRPKSEHEQRIVAAALSEARSSKAFTGTMAPVKPPAEPPKNLGDDLIHSKNSAWSSEKERILLGPYDYLDSQPGKDIRALLISAFNAWLRVPEDRLAVITKVVGMLHTSSLLVDDVEDSSLLRRGEPVAHSIFGIPQAINSANYVYFLALQQLSTLNSPRVIQIFTEELLNLHRGQGMDLFWRDTLTCPSEADYLEMVHHKTGGLFRLAVKLMEAESSIPTATNSAPLANGTGAGPSHDDSVLSCIPLINTIGLMFQILDDLLNLQSPIYASRKGHAEDLTEGKFSFPVIHAIRTSASTAVNSGGSERNNVLLNVLRQKTTDAEVKRYAVSYMDRMGSFEYTKKVIADLEAKAVQEVARLRNVVGGEDGRIGEEKILGVLGKLKAL
jgi:geranylgeranyl diphosphate synthase, type III